MSSQQRQRGSLPERPDLSQLKKRARSLLNAVRLGSSDAFARVAAQHPRLAAAGPLHCLQCRLSDAQLVLAREHGFASWPMLVAHLTGRTPSGAPAPDSNRTRLAWTQQLFQPLATLTRRVAWLSRPELERLQRAGDWLGLASFGYKLCSPDEQRALDAASSEPARVSLLLKALTRLADSARAEPLGLPSDAPDDEASACLVVLYAGGYPQLLGRRFGLSQPVTELGRSAHNHITLHSDGISRSHARIVREQADFVLVDDGSTNGTFVDQEAERTVRRVLCDGDQIMLGDAILVFLSGKDLAQRYRAAIAYLSEHDGLTRLANHAHWLRLTEHGVLLARAEQRPLSLLLVDIDHLAQVNQRVGALGGNSVLSAIADALRAELGSEAVLGRTEGGRFGVALPGRDLATSVGLGERLRQRVAGRTLTVRGESLQVTLSVGAATLYRNTGSQELLEDAQAALLRAKAGGRDRVCAAHD